MEKECLCYKSHTTDPISCGCPCHASVVVEKEKIRPPEIMLTPQQESWNACIDAHRLAGYRKVPEVHIIKEVIEENLSRNYFHDLLIEGTDQEIHEFRDRLSVAIQELMRREK